LGPVAITGADTHPICFVCESGFSVRALPHAYMQFCMQRVGPSPTYVKRDAVSVRSGVSASRGFRLRPGPRGAAARAGRRGRSPLEGGSGQSRGRTNETASACPRAIAWPGCLRRGREPI